MGTLLRLWPAPPPASAGVTYDASSSLVVRTRDAAKIAEDQLWREGLLMNYAVGNDRINAIWDRMIENKLRPRVPPPLRKSRLPLPGK